MIKGVNKNIIEISDTGHDCFERAILFVRQDCAADRQKQMPDAARSYVSGLTFSASLHRRRGFALFVTAVLAGLGGAGAATAFFLLLWH